MKRTKEDRFKSVMNTYTRVVRYTRGIQRNLHTLERVDVDIVVHRDNDNIIRGLVENVFIRHYKRNIR